MSLMCNITHWRKFISQYGRAVNLHNLWCAWVYKHKYKIDRVCCIKKKVFIWVVINQQLLISQAHDEKTMPLRITLFRNDIRSNC